MTVLRDNIFQALGESLRGELIQPDDQRYDTARKLYNGMIDRRPRAIARCADVSDVTRTVSFAREQELLLAVRGGGHNGGGLGSYDDGLVMDLSRMRGVRVDPARQTARVEGGCTWGDVDHATRAFGLATPSGVVSTTGVGGLTLGGGIGYLTRKPTLWPLNQAAELMRWYHDFITTAPEDVNGLFAFLTVPPEPPFPERLHLQRMCGVIWCYTGPKEGSDAAFKPVRDFGPPALDGIQTMAFPVPQSAFDGLYPPDLLWYWKADFFNELSGKGIAVYVEHGSRLPTMHLYPINGAAHRVSRKDTAFSYREATWAEVIVGVDPDPAEKEQITTWAKEYWDALHPHSAGGAYVNFMMDEGENRVKDTYRDNYERLAAVKARFDPTNLFRVNQNIQPTSSACR
jgi:hypothetical protein